MTRYCYFAFAMFAACHTAANTPPPLTTTTTTSPPTTVTTVPATAPPTPAVVEAPRARPRTAAAVGLGASSDVWERLAVCESGMTNMRGGTYSGYFSFLPSTWRSLGLAGMPADHSYEEQRAAAQRLVARSGWGQFPGCARKLGLR